jgi:hypothetical protein
MRRDLTSRESIVDRVSAREVLREAGVPMLDDARKLMRCPLKGHDDSTPSFRVFGRGYVCFGGCGKGGVLDLAVALGKAHDRASAARWLEERVR